MKISDSFEVDVSPHMNMYRLLQSQNYTIHSALSEFVDNSVQSYIDNKNTTERKNELKIKISINNETKEIIILDNAYGISRENFQKAIKMNTNTSHKTNSLSKFGVGMKTAAVWLSDTWAIETSALNYKEKLISNFNLDKLLETGKKEIPVHVESEKEKNHYTKIIIQR